MEVKFDKVIVVGPGLIGGSLGIIFKKRRLARLVIGVARHKATLKNALKMRAIDFGSQDLKKAVKQADLIVLAVPVAAIKEILFKLKDICKNDCIIFDVGSTKREIVKTAERILPKNIYFIGTHPMAGSEKTGVNFARETLFKNSLCFITKTKKTNPQALKKVVKLWRAVGTKTKIVTCREHDKIVSRISHLPHLVSVALVNSVAEKFLPYAAIGFKDTTRIASSDPGMWRDISFSNKLEIKTAFQKFERQLKALKESLQKNKEANFMRLLEKAKFKRDKL